LRITAVPLCAAFNRQRIDGLPQGVSPLFILGRHADRCVGHRGSIQSAVGREAACFKKCDDTFDGHFVEFGEAAQHAIQRNVYRIKVRLGISEA